MNNTETLLKLLKSGDFKTIGRCITIVENDLPESEKLLTSLSIDKNVPIIGITGPPGAGKSSLVNELLEELLLEDKKIGILAVDPTSPFNLGSILGDRVRMSEHFNNPNVYIRSIATRGSLGGLSAKIIEIADVMRSANFDVIIVETVGVGQSEIEIVGLADITVLVLVPEAGDEIQQLKSGVMEIADVFAINKADRPGADVYIRNLHTLLHSAAPDKKQAQIVKTIATKHEGIKELLQACNTMLNQHQNDFKTFLLAEKAYRLIQNERMKMIDKLCLKSDLEIAFAHDDFNLYAFVKTFMNKINQNI
jgi:LAO/AO transport system kinase